MVSCHKTSTEISKATCIHFVEHSSILYDHQKMCEKNGKYMEADLAKKKLAELRVELQRKTK